MKKLLRKLAWCRIPFTYGLAIESKSHRSQSDSVKYVRFNGLISSIQMFIGLVTVSFAITLAVFLSVRFDGTISLIAMILYMLAGLAVMFVFNVRRDRVLVPTVFEGGKADSRDSLTLIGITIFYVLGCLLDMFNTITSISCDHVWKICNDYYIYVSYVTEIIFHVLRIAYLGGETVFCISFNRSTFSDKPSTRYGLMFLLAANISLWFDALVHESAHMFTTRPRMSRFSQRCLANNMNVSEDVLHCVYHNNTLYKMAKTYISPTFLPFTIEFTLLAGECLCHWFFHCAASDVVAANGNARDDRVSTVGGTAEDDVDNIRPEEQNPDESLSASSGSGDFDSFSESEEALPLLPRSDDGQPRTSSAKSDFLLVAIILVNVLLGVLAILPKIPGLPGVAHYRNLFSAYLFVFWLGMTVSLAVGYQVSRDFRYDRKATFGGLDYLLLLSSVGSLAFDVFTLIAVSGYKQQQLYPNATLSNLTSSASPWLMVFLELCNAVETYFQVAFSLFAGRTILSATETSGKAAIFRGLILFLASANGSLWLVGTFNAFETGQDLQIDYFGQNGWAVINNFITPLSLFFRFNSCILFTRLYLRFRRKSETFPSTTATGQNG